MKEKRIINFESCENADDVFINASQLYNYLFSKEDKVRLEETNDQKDIESEIRKRLRVVNFKTLFNNW